MTGAKGPSILTYVRYHVDKEIADLMRKGHHGVPAQIPTPSAADLGEMRKLAGTNPAMATGGYTGSRAAGPPPASFPPSEPRPEAPESAQTSPRRSRWPMEARERASCSGSRSRRPTLLENGHTKFTLLSRDGDVYREKPIAPKRDWLMYDGSHTGNRYSTLDQINRDECSASRAGVDIADARVAASEHSGRRRRHHVRHRMERALGARCDDRTTLWS